MFSISSFGLDVMLNGQRRRMQIDTGASGIILTSAAAKRLGLTAEYHLKAGGVGDRGDVDSYLTHVANIQIGDIQISDCMVEVLQKSDLGVQDGLIGLDVFDKWLVTLDYPLNELRLGPLPSIPGQKVSETLDDQNRLPTDRYIAPEMKDWLKIARVGHELLLPSRLNKGTVHLLLIDTGASQTTFSPSFAKEAGPLGTDYSTKFRGLSGDINHVYHTGDVVLQFGSLLLPASQFSVFDITSVSHNTGVEVSGFVGLPTLSRLTVAIDYRDNLLQLKYDPKHDSRHFRGK
jgi:predicted aspartyl protease